MLKIKKFGVSGSVQAYCLLVLTTFCWGLNAVFARFAAGEISPMLLVTIRWLGTLFLLLLFAGRTIIEGLTSIRQNIVYTILMGLVGLGVFGTLIYYSAHYTTAVNIGIIQGAMPAIVLLGSCWFLKTSVNIVQIAGVVITMLGVVFVSINGELENLLSLSFNKGDLMMLIAVLFYGSYTVGLQRKHNLSSIVLFASVVFWALISTLPFTIYEFASGKTVWPDKNMWIIVALIILLPSFVSQICFIASVYLIGPARSGVFINLVPVFASFLAVQLLGESFEIYHGLSLLFVLSGIFIFEKFKTHVE